MSEGTRTDTTAMENEALIAEMLRDAKKAEVDSELKRNPVIHKGDEEMPAPMTVKEMTDAGYVWIYNTQTGEQIPCLYYMVPAKLRIKNKETGAFQFTTNDPGFRPKMGTLKCMLHPEGPNREHYDEMGLRTCKKSNITNNHQLRQHMIRKHKQEWEAIQEEIKQREREEDRAMQKLMMAGVLGKMKAEDSPETPPAATSKKSGALVCPKCGADFTNETVFGKHVEQCDK